MTGKIICINAAIHKVLLENNTIIDTKTRGKLRNEKVEPVVGDNVLACPCGFINSRRFSVQGGRLSDSHNNTKRPRPAFNA